MSRRHTPCVGYGRPRVRVQTLGDVPPCAVDCDGKQCGASGRGDVPCGTCPDGSLCDEEQTCEDVSALRGNTCANPRNVAALPFTDTGDTSARDDNYWVRHGMCAFDGFQSDVGQETGDAVYAYTPTEDGAITVTVESAEDLDLLVYVVTDCRIDKSCVAGWNEAPNWPDVAQLHVEAATTYYIIIDGADSAAEGAYTLTVETCTPTCGSSTCGGDTCGGSCGQCDDDETCWFTDDVTMACFESNSCEGVCGGYAPPSFCSCAAGCAELGECCPDFCDACPAEAAEEDSCDP